MTKIDDTQIEQAFNRISDINPPEGLRGKILSEIGLPITPTPVSEISPNNNQQDDNTVVVMPKKSPLPVGFSISAVAAILLLVVMAGSAFIKPQASEQLATTTQTTVTDTVITNDAATTDTYIAEVMTDPLATSEYGSDPLIAMAGF